MIEYCSYEAILTKLKKYLFGITRKLGLNNLNFSPKISMSQWKHPNLFARLICMVMLPIDFDELILLIQSKGLVKINPDN